MMDWIPIIGMVTSTIMVIVIVFLVTSARTKRAEAQMMMQTRLIDRFGSAPELIEFLHSPAGRQFVAGVQTAPALMARERIMSGFTRAIIMTALGAGFIVLALLSHEEWYIPAIIVFSLGIGYLLATFVTWRFSKDLGTEQQLPPALRGDQNNA